MADGEASLLNGDIDWGAVGEMSVELAGKGDGCIVGDGELHGDDCREFHA